MRFCLVLKGISYIEDYISANTDTKDVPYEIDFEDCWPFMKKNIIVPLKEKGHTVDIFFNTYNNIKLTKFIKLCDPVSVEKKEYNNNIKSGNYSHINFTVLEALLHVKKYQQVNNIEYDYIISGRFDFFLYDKITNLHIIDDGLSLFEPRADMTVIFTQNILDKYIHLLINNPNMMVHDFAKLLKQFYDVKVHTMYIFGKKSYKKYPDDNFSFGPGIACHRNVFIKNKNHWFKTNDMKRIKDFEGMYDPENWYKLLEGNSQYCIKTNKYTPC